MKKIKSEKEMRKQLLTYARQIGAEDLLKQTFQKWDNIISQIPSNKINDIEEAQKDAILEVQYLLNIEPEHGLTIGNKTIIERKK